MKPLVSILIPAFNSGRWISETIRSALAQTWPEKELVIVDDGSTDDTLEVARRFESERVRVFSQSNGGASQARNRAFSESKGEFIQWLDADDVLEVHKIASQLEWLGKNGYYSSALVSGPWGRFYSRPARSRFEPTSLWETLSPREWLLRKMRDNVFMAASSWLMPRVIVERTGGWNTKLSLDDDGEYICRTLRYCEAVGFCDYALTACRRGQLGSLSSLLRRPREKLESQWNSNHCHVRTLVSFGHTEDNIAVCAKYLQRWLIYYYPEHPDIVAHFLSVADELGIELRGPLLPKKYILLKWLFGWRSAKWARFGVPQIRGHLRRYVEPVRYMWTRDGRSPRPLKWPRYG